MPPELKNTYPEIESCLKEIAESFPAVEIDRERVREQVAVLVNPGDLRKLMEKLSNWKEYPLNYLRCITAIDKLTHIEVVYVLINIPGGGGLTVIARCPREDGKLPSVFDLWHTADFQEREVFDFFGVKFEGHPDLRRLLMSEEIKGHPLLKDYPKGGDPDDLVTMKAYLPDGWLEKMQAEKERLKQWLKDEVEKIKSQGTVKPEEKKEKKE